MKTYCPMSGKPLKVKVGSHTHTHTHTLSLSLSLSLTISLPPSLSPPSLPPLPLFQDLIPVKFTPVADGDSKAAAIVKEARYMCPVTRDTLSNSVPSVLLRPRYTSYTLKTQVEIIEYRDRVLFF